MIKRNGVALMNERTGNVRIARETIEILKNGGYTNPNGDLVDISDDLFKAINGTILYGASYTIPRQKLDLVEATIEVTDETTTKAAVRLLEKTDNVVALNFASARNPGGGFLAGAVAQEEDLARSSGLYVCVKSKPMFYNENILCDDTMYTDNIIYSPNVPFFRDDHNRFLTEPYLLSVISAPAPNVRAVENLDEDLLYWKLYDRALRVLQIAAKHNHRTIILGAWGCGAFGNPPELVSEVFVDALMALPAFDHVCFAVYDTRPDQPVYNTFKQAFGV